MTDKEEPRGSGLNSLGKVAYEAYAETTDHRSLVSGDPLPSWDDLPEPIQRAWADAARAVRQSIHLRGVDLWGSDLRGVDLRGVDLRGADLRRSDLRGADLREADLRGADLQEAVVRGIVILEQDLDYVATSAGLKGVDFDRGAVQGAVVINSVW